VKFSFRLYKPLEFKELRKIKDFLFGINKKFSLLNKIDERKILYIDLPLEYKDYPTISGLYELKNKVKDKVYLDEEGTVQFIYGKDVRQKNFLKVEGYKYAKHLLVLNSEGDPLGVGRIEGKLLRNLFNISYYRKY